MELELVGGSLEDTGTYGFVNGQYGYTSATGQFSPMSPASNTFNYQPPQQSGFASFVNNFLTPERINALGGLFTKKPETFNNDIDYGKETNYTGVLVVGVVLVALIVLVIIALRKRKK